MKTIYSIGRDPGCDIYLYDDKNVISRNHAILKIGKGGKYFISDQSMNGTYINGIKVTPGVQVPVTRKDVVTFAHVAELDWSLIPNTGLKTLKSILFAALAVLIIGGVAYGVVKYMDQAKPTPQQQMNTPIPAAPPAEEDEEAKKKEEAREKERLEWEKKVRAAEARKKEKAAQEKKDAEKKAETEQPKTEESTNVDPII